MSTAPFTWTFKSPGGRTYTASARTEEEARNSIHNEYRDGRLMALTLIAPWEMLSTEARLKARSR